MSLRTTGRKVSITASAQYTGPYPNTRGEVFDLSHDYADAQVSVFLIDSFKLSARNNEPIPVGAKINLNWTVDGFLQVGDNVNNNGVGANFNRASFTATVGSGLVNDAIRATLSNSIFNNPAGDFLRMGEYDPQLGVTGTVNSAGEVSYSLAVGLNVYTVVSFATANLGNTITFDSITFEDGTTPEDNGFDLIFASGITSPNLVAEPATSSALILGAMLLCLRRTCRHQ